MLLRKLTSMKLTSDDMAIYDDLHKAQDMERTRYDIDIGCFI